MRPWPTFRTMPIDKTDYIVTVLRTNPGELVEILASAWTTFKYRHIKRCIGKGTIVRRKTQIVNCANVQIGNNCVLQDFVYIRAGARGKVELGDGCMVNSFCRFFGHGGIEVGQCCQFGPGVTVTTTAHDYRQENLSEIFKKVIIGERVWIGANVTILPGVTIGHHAVVGAGSVVTKDVPPQSVAVGTPAQAVKSFHIGKSLG